MIPLLRFGGSSQPAPAPTGPLKETTLRWGSATLVRLGRMTEAQARAVLD